MDAWKYIQEERVQKMRWQTLVMPLARTPQSRQGVQSMKSYSSKLDKILDSLTPWTASSKFSALRRQYEGKMPEGSQVIVEFDANDNPDGSLFSGTNEPAEVDDLQAED